MRLLEKNRKCLEKSHRSASRKRGSSGNLPKVDKLDNPEILGKLALNTMPSPKFNYDAKHYDSEIPPSTDGPSSSEQSFVCSLESKDLSESFETFGKLRINPNESVENDDTRIKPANYNFITEHHKKASTDTC